MQKGLCRAETCIQETLKQQCECRACVPQLGNTGSVKSLICSLALLWLSKASLGLMPGPGNHAHPMPEHAAGYVRESFVPMGIPRAVGCLRAGRVRGCPEAGKLPPRGPSSVPLQFGRELHGGK